MNRRIIHLLVVVAFVLSASSAVVVPRSVSAAATTYYVDCASGSDTNSGTSPIAAWKSLPRANKATLAPGDQLLLKRECVWTGPLTARWTGTASAPIRIGAYGSGALPLIRNAPNDNVKISGAFQIIEFLQTHHDPASYDYADTSCLNQPIGWRIGFNFLPNSHDNLLRSSEARHSSAGVSLHPSTARNRIIGNQFANNDGLWQNVPGDALGGTGIALQGRDHEIAWNTFQDNRSWCAKDPDGTINVERSSISIELYQAVGTNVHHNRAIGDRVFVELGSSATVQSADNRFVYNTHTTSARKGEFLITRGANTVFGPVWRTTVANNTIHYTGSESQAVICMKCTPDVLTLEDNILVAGAKALYVGPGESLLERHNLYWPSAGLPLPTHFIQNLTPSATSLVANPLLVDPLAGDLHLSSASPAIDRGSNQALALGYPTDIDAETTPVGPAADIGADERASGSTQEPPVEEPPVEEPPVEEPPVDTNTPPTASAPVVSVHNVKLNPNVSLIVRFGATDTDGIGAYDIELSTNGSAFAPVKTISTTATSVEHLVALPVGKDYQFRIRATDSLGASSEWVVGDTFRLGVRQESSSAVVDVNTWSTSKVSGAFGGALQYTSQGGSAVRLTFTGTSVAWITSRGPDRGRVEVWLDGVRIRAVDLYDKTVVHGAPMFVQNGLADTTHTLELRVMNVPNPASSGKRVDVDAFILVIPNQ